MASPQSAPGHSPQSLPSISALTQGLPSASQRTSVSSRLSDRQLSGSYRLSNMSNSSIQSPRPPLRDSGYSGSWFDAGPGISSKHSSMNNKSPVTNLLNPEDVPSTPPGRHSQTLPSINQGFETASFHRSSGDYQSTLDSRRSSVDSRMHSGFHSLAINHAPSPYDKTSQPQLSLSGNPRNITLQTPLSPPGSRHSSRVQQITTRVAPPIQPVSRTSGAPDPTASKPTQGFPWAFPDASIQEETFSPESYSDSPPVRSMSRQGSVAASSVRSSVLSIEGHLPAGQRRFEDGMAFQKIIGLDVKTGDSAQDLHSMQHRSVLSLPGEMSALGASNYTRTPELRVSHKLAERKRRSEMKDLFEDLNKVVPNNGGAKSSKWEILTKAIDYIKQNQQQSVGIQNEMNRLRSAAEYARESHKEIEVLRAEVYAMAERLSRVEPNAPHVYGKYTSQLAQQRQQQSQGSARAIPSHYGQPASHVPSGPSAMQGVEYGERQPRG